MQLVIYGPGRLGGAIAATAAAAGWPAPVLVGRPDPDGRRLPPPRADVVVDASASAAVVANVEEALLAGSRAFVLATTGWDADIGRIRGSLIEHGATAIAAPNLSLGAALFLRLAELAAGVVCPRRLVRAVDRGVAPAGQGRPPVRHRQGPRPSHRRRRSAMGHERRVRRPPDPRGGRDPRRGGARDASRDVRRRRRVDRAPPGGARPSAYAEGAVAAARWLVREPRAPGLHPFDAVVDDLLADDAQLLPA